MKSLFVTVVLISMVVVTRALDCYTCSGSACQDTFTPNTSLETTCVAPANTYCSKVVTGTSVVRSCGLVCVEGCILGICSSCCDSNLCNRGTSVTTSFVAMGVVMLAAFILARQ